MLPIYPKLKPLELTDKYDIEELVSSYPPYSDFNFVSLWSWNIHDSAKVGTLNGNLVVLFQDYITNEAFFTFIGEQHVQETVDTLLSNTSKFNVINELRLIPEHTIRLLSADGYEVMEDNDNHDYIVSIQDISEMKGTAYLSKRNHVNRFTREFGHTSHLRHIDIRSQKQQEQILTVFETWQRARAKLDTETINELKAIQRLFQGTHIFDLHSMGLFFESELVAFAIHEKVQQKYVVFHFEKADTNYVGIFEYCKRHVSTALLNDGSVYMNLEQDLGIEGLRKAKQSYRPVHFLKKYTVKRV